MLKSGMASPCLEVVSRILHSSGADPERVRLGSSRFVRTPLFDNLLQDEELQQRYSKAIADN